MKSKHRWLHATIKYTKDNPLELPWAGAKNRRNWSKRCAARANSRT